MRFVAAVSGSSSLDLAVEDTANHVLDALGGKRPKLAIVFASNHHAVGFERVPGLLCERLGRETLVFGSSAAGVIGDGRELEDRPGFTLTAAELEGVDITPFHLETPRTPSPGALATDWQPRVGADPARSHAMLLIPDPFTSEPEPLLRGLDLTYPHTLKVGGLASGGRGPAQNALFLEESTLRSGTIGLSLSGELRVDAVVSQGCRPIGDPMFVTKIHRDQAGQNASHVIRELNGKPALAALRELHESLPEADRRRFGHSLFIGLAMRETQTEFGHGDFLVRNIVGADPKVQAVVVGAFVYEHQIVQFHLRDPETSRDDLHAGLANFKIERPDVTPKGALMFNCLGRGLHLYGHPDHDTDILREHLGSIPVGGFFCNGEIGPVAGHTFLHGFTSSIALFRERRASGEIKAA